VVAAGPRHRRRPSRKDGGIAGGAIVHQYPSRRCGACLVLPDGATAKDGASSFVNPLTALGMDGNHAPEGHFRPRAHRGGVESGPDARQTLPQGRDSAGQRRPQADQEELLRSLGAVYTCNSASPFVRPPISSRPSRRRARTCVRRHGRRHAGKSDPHAWRKAANATAAVLLPLGSTVHKQVYTYGGLDTSRPSSPETSAMAWGIGGWAAHDRSLSAQEPRPSHDFKPGGRRTHHDVRQHHTRKRSPSQECCAPTRQRLVKRCDGREVPRHTAGGHRHRPGTSCSLLPMTESRTADDRRTRDLEIHHRNWNGSVGDTKPFSGGTRRRSIRASGRPDVGTLFHKLAATPIIRCFTQLISDSVGKSNLMQFNAFDEDRHSRSTQLWTIPPGAHHRREPMTMAKYASTPDAGPNGRSPSLVWEQDGQVHVATTASSAHSGRSAVTPP